MASEGAAESARRGHNQVEGPEFTLSVAEGRSYFQAPQPVAPVQLVEQRSRILQVFGVEAFGESVVDLREHPPRLIATPL